MNVVVNPNFGHWICTICLSLLHYTHAYALLSLVGADGSQCGFVVTYYHMLLFMVTEKMADTMTGFLCCISVFKNLRFYCLRPAVCILLMFSLLKKNSNLISSGCLVLPLLVVSTWMYFF